MADSTGKNPSSASLRKSVVNVSGNPPSQQPPPQQQTTPAASTSSITISDSGSNSNVVVPTSGSSSTQQQSGQKETPKSGNAANSGGNANTLHQEMFRIGIRLELPPQELVEQFAKFSMGEINCFALAVKKSEELLLLSDHHWSSGLNESGQNKWSMKRVPWYNDPLKRITALSFDDEGTLYIGTLDGSILELKALRLLSDQDQRDSDLNTLYRLLHKIVQILVWNQDNNKTLLCVGSHGNLAIISGHSTPVNVTFTASIVGVELFLNKAGLTCALVCLETGHNVYTVLDDLDLPSQQNESQAKKSIFRKAKDNLMSRLSEDKLMFFGSKKPKQDTAHITHGNASSTGPSSNITSSPINSLANSSGAAAAGPHLHTSGGGGKVAHAETKITTGSSSAQVKFQSLEEFQCRGTLKKVRGRSQFLRHASNKIDIFDDDFRQVSSVFVPSNISDVYVINRLYYCFDQDGKQLRICLIHNGSLKDIAVIVFQPHILSVETIGESSDASYSVFIIATDGIYELTLRKDPIFTCVYMLLKETSASLLDAVCNALNVSKSQVCAIAGDIRADEGKFSKSILYYKLAGLTYAQISAKFGSKGLMAAMLFFFELVDQEKTKLYGGFQDKQVMSNLALLGRIEQYLRYGSVRSKDTPRNPTVLLQNIITKNTWYSSRRAAEWLADPELMWGMKLLAQSRRCYPEILQGLQTMEEAKLEESLQTFLIWRLITEDWLALYSAPPVTFVWFRQVVLQHLRLVSEAILNRLLLVLLPWRRELQRKIFSEISDTSEIINYAQPMNIPKIMLDDYVELFVVVLLEVIRRKISIRPLPTFVFKSDARAVQRTEISNHKNNMVATLMLSFTFQKTLSASNSHVLCVRNGKVYAWGENKFGKLGLASPEGSTIALIEEKEKLQCHTPTPINILPSLKIHIDSVSVGSNHSVALTSVGTLLVWGQNTYGQLGLGRETLWTSRPVPLHVPDVIFTCVAAGGYHTVAVDHLNRAWTFGWGIHGQLGNGEIENCFEPQPIIIKEKIVSVSAGHSHTAFLSCFGRVLVTGCNHFGQLGLGIPDQKVKVPTMINGLPSGTLIRIVECGISSTVMVSTKNRLFYAGLNPASLKSLLNSSRRKEKGQRPTDADVVEEEKDFSDPAMIDTSHMAGDIQKVNCSSTHFAVMSSLGYVYTWGVGKSGQLVRPDDDSKSLELIYSADEKMIIASDICCAGDCTFVVEKESGLLFGCGFNSCGQLGKMESEEDQAVMMIRTKKRVVKVRQPSNIYFKLREIPGLPKQHSWETDNSVMTTHKICPPTSEVGQELLEWVITAFRRNYDASRMIQNCVKAENFAAASILETMAENHEQAFQHNLAGAGENKVGSLEAINKYLGSLDFTKRPSLEQACRFLTIVIHHWSKFQLQGCDLEEILDSSSREDSNWGPCLCSALKEIVALADESAEWMAENLTPVFILKCINESNRWNPEEDSLAVIGSQKSNGNSTNNDGNSSVHVPCSSSNMFEEENESATLSSSSSTSGASSLPMSVLNGNVSFGNMCKSSISK